MESVDRSGRRNNKYKWKKLKEVQEVSKPLHMVSAWACKNQLVLGQPPMKNEITAKDRSLNRLQKMAVIMC